MIADKLCIIVLIVLITSALFVVSMSGGGGDSGGTSKEILKMYNAVATIGENKAGLIKKKRRRVVGNNCLFDATIDYLNNATTTDTAQYYSKSSQDLRDECNEVLRAEGLPIIEDGLPAGEQYIQALSKIFNSVMEVRFSSGNSFFKISHDDSLIESDDDGCGGRTIKLRHVGPQMAGHWISDL